MTAPPLASPVTVPAKRPNAKVPDPTSLSITHLSTSQPHCPRRLVSWFDEADDEPYPSRIRTAGMIQPVILDPKLTPSFIAFS